MKRWFCWLLVLSVGCTIPVIPYQAAFTTLPEKYVHPPKVPLVVVFWTPLSAEQQAKAIQWQRSKHPLTEDDSADGYLQSALAEALANAGVSAMIYHEPYQPTEMPQITRSLGGRYYIKAELTELYAQGYLLRDRVEPTGLLGRGMGPLGLLLLPVVAIVLIAEVATRKDVVSQKYYMGLYATMVDTQSNKEVLHKLTETREENKDKEKIYKGEQPPLQEHLLREIAPMTFASFSMDVQAALRLASAPRPAEPKPSIQPSTRPGATFTPPDWSLEPFPEDTLPQ